MTCIDTEHFSYTIRRQRRKTLALHVLADGRIELRAPPWVALRELKKFVAQRHDWLLERQAQALLKHQQVPAFVEGDAHFFLGERYALTISAAARASVRLNDDCLSIAVRAPDDCEQVEKALWRFYRRQAEHIFAQRLQACLLRFNDPKPVRELKIRRMRRRWGSCSSAGVITLNLQLIKMPQACIDYVICHELVHLWVFDHSPAFHRMMSEVMPEWKVYKQLLETHPER